MVEYSSSYWKRYMIYCWVNTARYKRVTLFILKNDTYICIFVCARKDRNCYQSEKRGKRDPFPFLLYMYLYWFAPCTGGGDVGDWNKAGEKKSTYLTLFLLIHRIFPFAWLLERFTPEMKSVHLNEILSSPHFLLESKHISASTDKLSHIQLEEIILYF